jgi:selenocysteine lyase/cysteine desulfurase
LSRSPYDHKVSDVDPPTPIPGARLLFSLDPSIAHLNHGSFGAVPIGVQRAQQRLRDDMEANPTRFFGVGLDERIAHTRRHLAAFVGAEPELTALVANATAGISLALRSLDLRAGDEIVMTNHGYGAATLAVADACAQTGATSRVVELPAAPEDADVVTGVLNAVSARTRLVVVDQITSATARTFPSAEIVAALRGSRTAVLVDGAHAPGISSEPVAEIGADFWVGNLHKWAYAPRPTALFAVAPQWRDRIRPLIISWHQPDGFPANVEWQATQDYTPWLAAPAGLFTLRSLGLDAVREHNVRLAAYGQRVLADALDAAADLPAPPSTPLPMRLVPLPTGFATTQESAMALRRRVADELDAEVAINPWPGGGLLRVSAQVYNRAEDYERLAGRLPGLLATWREPS